MTHPATGQPTPRAAQDRHLLAVHTNVRFAPVPNTTVVIAAALAPSPFEVPVTSACAMIRDAGGQVLLTRVIGRGYDLPGGHLERGETPADACRREVAEETGLALPTGSGMPLRLAAAIVVCVAAARPAGYSYPYPLSQMWIYMIRLTVHSPPVTPTDGDECDQALWTTPDDLIRRVGPRIWLPVVGAAESYASPSRAFPSG